MLIGCHGCGQNLVATEGAKRRYELQWFSVYDTKLTLKANKLAEDRGKAPKLPQFMNGKGDWYLQRFATACATAIQ